METGWFRDPQQVEKLRDHEFDVLRGRTDFQQFLKGLQAATKNLGSAIGQCHWRYFFRSWHKTRALVALCPEGPFAHTKGPSRRSFFFVARMGLLVYSVLPPA